MVTVFLLWLVKEINSYAGYIRGSVDAFNSEHFHLCRFVNLKFLAPYVLLTREREDVEVYVLINDEHLRGVVKSAGNVTVIDETCKEECDEMWYHVFKVYYKDSNTYTEYKGYLPYEYFINILSR